MHEQTRQSLLSGQVQAPATRSPFTPRWYSPQLFHQFACPDASQAALGEKFLLDPLQQVVPDEYQPQEPVNRLEFPATQIVHSINIAPDLEKRLDCLPLAVQTPQLHGIELGGQVCQQYRIFSCPAGRAYFTDDAA